MPCQYPIKAHYEAHRNDTGKRSITFKQGDGLLDRPVTVPCGKCPDCAKKYQEEWGARAYHEHLYHKESTFITLTYDDNKLPDGYDLNEGLNHEHFQRFMKRLRNHIKRNEKSSVKIKYLMCGEYGSKLGRPHFHAIIYGWTPKDSESKGTQTDDETGAIHKRITSKTMEKLWPHGFHTLGAVTIQTAKYIAKYAAKGKLNNPKETNYSEKVDSKQERYGEKRLEYIACSHGLGKQWALDNKESILANDRIVTSQAPASEALAKANIFTLTTPRAYLKHIEKDATDNNNQDTIKRLSELKQRRIKTALENTEIEYVFYEAKGIIFQRSMPKYEHIRLEEQRRKLIKTGNHKALNELRPTFVKNYSQIMLPYLHNQKILEKAYKQQVAKIKLASPEQLKKEAHESGRNIDEYTKFILNNYLFNAQVNWKTQLKEIPLPTNNKGERLMDYPPSENIISNEIDFYRYGRKSQEQK